MQTYGSTDNQLIHLHRMEDVENAHKDLLLYHPI